MGKTIFVISETEPNVDTYFSAEEGKYTWARFLSDGSTEYYKSSSGGWIKVLSLPAPALLNHSHEGLNQLPNIIALLSNGITGSKTIGSYKFTFNHGVLVGFEVV